MHICLIALDYHSKGHGGGIATYSHSLAYALSADGHRVSIIAKSIPGEPAEETRDNIRVYRIRLGSLHWYIHKIPFARRIFPLLLRELEWSYAIKKQIQKISKKEPIDIIEGSESWNLFLLLSKKRPNLVMRLHGSTYSFTKHSGKPVFLNELIDRKIQLFCMRRASALTSPSAFQAEETKNEMKNFRRTIHVIPNSVSPELVEKARMSSIEQKSRKKMVLYTGRLEYRKGIIQFLKAVDRVRTEVKNVEFTLAGGPHISISPEEIDSLIKEEKIENNINLLGHVKWDNLFKLYQECEIFVMPSFYETFCISAVEAMLFAKPVIATKTSALPEVVRDGVTGLLVPPGDPGALSDAILTLLRDPDLGRRLGQAGRKRVLAEFNIEKTAGQTLDLYRKLA